MDTTTTTVLVVLVVAVLLLVAFLAWRKRQSAKLRDRFGPEYEREVGNADKRSDAERELKERAQRRDALDIRPLDPVRREGFATRWTQAQADFVDRPEEAVTAAQALVTEVMAERGYPVGDTEQQMKDLSVDHADVLDEYRSAHRISTMNDRHEATTEELRQAMVHYRSLFGRLLGGDTARDGDSTDRTDRRAEHAEPYPDDSPDRPRTRH